MACNGQEYQRADSLDGEKEYEIGHYCLGRIQVLAERCLLFWFRKFIVIRLIKGSNKFFGAEQNDPASFEILGNHLSHNHIFHFWSCSNGNHKTLRVSGFFVRQKHPFCSTPFI